MEKPLPSTLNRFPQRNFLQTPVQLVVGNYLKVIGSVSVGPQTTYPSLANVHINLQEMFTELF